MIDEAQRLFFRSSTAVKEEGHLRTFSFLIAVIIGIAVSFGAHAAPITTTFTDFQAFADGSVNGQFNWSATGPYDQSVVTEGGGNKALRISNKVTSGSFGDQIFAPKPGIFVGEGTSYNSFSLKFDVKGATASADPGARVTISPDDGQGARQDFVAVRDCGGLMCIDTFDVTAGGLFTGPQQLGGGLSKNVYHTIEFVLNFNNGPNNDVGKIYIDNVLAHTHGSWEQFYSVFQPGLHPTGVDIQTALFRVSGDSAPNAEGFLFDNVQVQVFNVPEPATMAMLGMGTIGLVGFRRRKKTA